MTAMSQPMRVLTSQGTTQWYTPPEYVAMVREVLGEINLDPASHPVAEEWIRAGKSIYTEGDGLGCWWYGRVFLNPPYPAAPWVVKLVAEFEAGRVTSAIALVNANLGYKWFVDFYKRFPCCLVDERIWFIAEDGKTRGQSKKASAFVGLGVEYNRFAAVFSRIGRVLPAETP